MFLAYSAVLSTVPHPQSPQQDPQDASQASSSARSFHAGSTVICWIPSAPLSIASQFNLTISSPFLANLIQRFGSYISRTGQPNIGVDHFL